MKKTSTFRFLKQTLKESTQALPGALADNWILITVLGGGTAWMTHHFTTFSAIYRNESSAQLLSQLSLLTWELTVSTLLCLTVPYHIMSRKTPSTTPRRSLIQLISHYGIALTIESLRALTVVLLWSLALILPGLYKMIRLSFVPLVVLFDSEYAAGKRDALKRSEELCTGKTLLLIGVVALTLLLDTGIDSVQGRLNLLEQPLVYIAFSVLSVMIYVALYTWLTAFYTLRVTETSGESQTAMKE